MCVVCALCVSVSCHSRTSVLSHLADTALPTPARSHTGSHLPTAPCVPRCTASAFCVVLSAWCSAPHCTVCALLHCCRGQGAVGSGTPAMHCPTAWGQWAVQLLQYTAPLPWGSGQWTSFNTPPHCLGAVGSGPPAIHCRTAWGQWAVDLLQCTAPLPGGSGQWTPHNTLPHCLGAVGSGLPSMHCPTAWGQWAVQLLQYTAALPGGSGQCNSCNALPHCPRAVGSGTPAMHCLTAWGQWVVQLLQCTTPLPWGSGQWNSCNALPQCLGAVGSGPPAMHCLTVWGSGQCNSCNTLPHCPGGGGQCNSCNALPRCLGVVGIATSAMQCVTAWGQWAVQLLQRTASLPWGSGQCNSCNALPHCLGAVGSGTPATHCLTAWGQWAVQLLQCTASPPGGSGQWNACNALPHCLGAVGSRTPAMHCPPAWGQRAVQLLQCTASLPWGSGQWTSCNALPHCLGAAGSGTPAITGRTGLGGTGSPAQGVPARCVVVCLRCPGPLGSCSPVCPVGVLCCVCGVLGDLAPVHQCARSVRCFACAVSWATWLLSTSVPAQCVALCVRCLGLTGSCSPVCVQVVCCFACAVFWATWLLFTGVLARCAVLRVRCPGPLDSCSPVCPRGLLCCVCGVPGHLAFVHRCARSVCCFACAVSWATWLLFTGVPAWFVVLRVRCSGPLSSCSPVFPLCLLLWVPAVLGHLAPVHRCARSVCYVACAMPWANWLLFTGVPARCVRSVCRVACTVSWAPWLLFTGVPTRCVVVRVRCPGPLGSCSPVCRLSVLCCVCGVLGPLAPVHRCARSVCCVACAVSLAIWLPFTGAPARCAVLRVRCPGPLGSCSPVCPLGVLCCVRCVLGHLAPVHRCARSVCRVACMLFWAPYLLFTGVPARCVVVRVRCPGPLGSCSPVCPLGVLCCVCGVLGHLAPVHRCARSVCRVACTVSWAPWLLFTGVPTRCVVLRVCCSGPLISCSPVCPLGVLWCVCGVLGPLAPVHRCAGSVCCVACAVSWAPWLLSTGVPARCIVLRVRCPWPFGSCSPVRPLGVLCYVCGVLGPLAPVHQCARSVCCVACAVSWATWLLSTGAPARFVVLRVCCSGPLISCSPVCPLGVLWCVCGVLGPLAPVHRCAHSVCCVACAGFWATWLLFTDAPAQFVVLRLRCPGPFGSCSPVRPCGVLCYVCCVLGPLAPVHQCACSVCCVACAVSWATWLLSTGAPARFVVLPVCCPGPLGSCSQVCPLGVLCCVCGVLGHLAPVHRCARSVCCVACAVSWATWLPFTGEPARFCCVACTVSWAIWLLFTGAPALCPVSRARCPGPIGTCSTVCPPGVLCCAYGVLGPLAPVHRSARSMFCGACAVSWAPWLLFTGVPRRCLCCVCGVLGHLAPVHRCARSVCCVACAVSSASWLLFTGAPPRCAGLHARCPGPLVSCSPVCPLCVLCCAYGVLAPLLLFTGVLAWCVVPCVVWAGGRCGAHTRPSGQRLFVAGRGWVPSGRVLVHPDGGCFVAGRGWVPSGCPLVHPDGGCTVAGRGWFAAGRAVVHPDGSWCCLAPVLLLWLVACCARSPGLRHPAAVVAWHLSVCLGCGRRRASLACLVAPRGAPRLVWSGCSQCSGRLCRRRGAFPHPEACAPGFIWWLHGVRGGRPRTGLIVPAAGPRRSRGAKLAPRRTRLGPRDGVVPGWSLWRRSRAACAAVVGVCGPGH